MYDYELAAAALKLLRDCFNVQPGETVAITIDTGSDIAVANATAQSAVILGAKPLVLNMPAARGCGKAGDPDFAIEALVGLLSNVDVWVEYNTQWLFYSTAYDRIVAANKHLRYMVLVDCPADLFIRNIGRPDLKTLGEFIRKAVEITCNAKHIRITTPAGTDISFENMPGREFGIGDGVVNSGDVRTLPGQVGWAPKFETINGVITFDASLVPAVGVLSSPVSVYVEKGRGVRIEGGPEARIFEKWLASFNDPLMFNPVHVCYGFGPNAILTGKIIEDERVWGSTEWGFGNLGACLTIPDMPEGIVAASHCDGICLNSTVYLDEKVFLLDGEVVGPTPDVVALARKLHV